MKSKNLLEISFTFIPEDLEKIKGLTIEENASQYADQKYLYRTTIQEKQLQDCVMEIFRDLARKGSNIRFRARMI